MKKAIGSLMALTIKHGGSWNGIWFDEFPGLVDKSELPPSRSNCMDNVINLYDDQFSKIPFYHKNNHSFLNISYIYGLFWDRRIRSN